MDEIVRMYGRFVLTGMTLLCMTVFVIGDISVSEKKAGLLELLGNYIKIEKNDYISYRDFNGIYAAESEKEGPKIVYEGGSIKKGTYFLNALIKAYDYAKREMPVVVDKIIGPYGNNLSCYDAISGKIDFNRCGVYELTVSAVDDGNRCSWCIIKVPVNE